MLKMDEVVYDPLVQTMQARLTLLSAGFPIVALLQERGRLGQLEKMRGICGRLRSAPRSEVPSILKSLLPEIKDFVEMEQLPVKYREQLSGLQGEITNELDALNVRTAALAATAANPASATISSATVGKSAAGLGLGSVVPTTATMRSSMTSVKTKGKGESVKFGRNTSLLSSTAVSSSVVSPSVDPVLVKQWGRQLGILLFSCELPSVHQEAVLLALAAVEQQKVCNELVDKAVSSTCLLPTQQLRRRLTRDSETIVAYLEAQVGAVSEVAVNLTEFFLRLSKLAEEHRKKMGQLDEKIADELWDLAEEHRFEKEDNEADYEKACEKIRQSTK